jgi:O-acetylhomoserine (thiol)-lyase
MAAITASILNIATAGSHVVSSSSLYGGTCTLFTHTLPKMGVEVTMVDPNDPNNFGKAVRDNTRAMFIETIGNPKNDVLDYPAIAKIAHQNGVPLICDNTVASPMLFRPIEHGIDIVVHCVLSDRRTRHEHRRRRGRFGQIPMEQRQVSDAD